MKLHAFIYPLVASTLSAGTEYPPIPEHPSMLLNAAVERKVTAPFYAEIPTRPVNTRVEDIAVARAEQPVLEKLALHTPRLMPMAVIGLPHPTIGGGAIPWSNPASTIPTSRELSVIPTLGLDSADLAEGRSLLQTPTMLSVDPANLQGARSLAFDDGVALGTIPSSRSLVPTAELIVVDVDSLAPGAAQHTYIDLGAIPSAQMRTFEAASWMNPQRTLAAAPAQRVFAPMGSIIVPDSFTIGLAFDWKPPHGQWMNQMLKDIEKARKAGDTQTHERLSKQYRAWAEKYLRRDNPPHLDGLR
jgi:hypothetical protein